LIDYEVFGDQLIVLTTLDVVGVQVLVGSMAAGALPVTPLLIEVHQGLVLMGLADDLALVLAIDGLHPLLADNVDVLLGSGLATAGDAAAETSHDLDEVVGRGSFADLVHQLPGAGIPAGHGDLLLEALGGLPLWLYVLQLDGGLLHLLQAYNGRDME